MPRILAFAPHRKKKVKLSWSGTSAVCLEGSATNGRNGGRDRPNEGETRSGERTREMEREFS